MNTSLRGTSNKNNDDDPGAPTRVLHQLESYVGSFNEGAVNTALKEREWGSEHSQEESPVFGYFVGEPIFQQYFRPAALQGFTNVTSAWVVNGMPAGICFREDLAETTNDDSCFVPHVVTREGSSAPKSKIDFKYPLSAKAKRLRGELYGKQPVGNSEGKESLTYEEYQNSHGHGPMGFASTGGGGGGSHGGGGWGFFRGGRTSWNPFGSRGGDDGKKNKASGSAGQRTSNWAKQQRPMGGRTKGQGGGVFRTGATARGAARRGGSGRS
jgi:hypothetical protein